MLVGEHTVARIVCIADLIVMSLPMYVITDSQTMDDQAEEFSIDEHFRIVGYAEQLFWLVYCIAVCCQF